jgi:putative FmdB family regulatory protein
MHHHEFFCHSCKRTFSEVLTLVEYEEGEVVCPHCGSSDVEQSWSAFYAIATRKSA